MECPCGHTEYWWERYRSSLARVSSDATAETLERFYKAVDARNVPLGELLKQALEALERAGGAG
jgi:CHAT domain-containing protein